MFTGKHALDMAARLAERERETGIASVRAVIAGAGSQVCDDCGGGIDPDRRAAVPFARRCFACQTIHEHQFGRAR